MKSGIQNKSSIYLFTYIYIPLLIFFSSKYFTLKLIYQNYPIILDFEVAFWRSDLVKQKQKIDELKNLYKFNTVVSNIFLF